MRRKLYVLVFVFGLMVSCVQNDKFPEKHSERVSVEKLSVNQSALKASNQLADSILNDTENFAITELVNEMYFYENRNEKFNLEQLENKWQNIDFEPQNASFENLKNWIEITGFLLELTGKEVYAASLERVSKANLILTETEASLINEILESLVFTMNVDHVFVNLFSDATLQYNHSLNGKVKITQIVDSLVTGKVFIKFDMEKINYIELNIRIPEWAIGARVTEKRVKYVATPGSYCFIARKWSTGDVVEIVF